MCVCSGKAGGLLNGAGVDENSDGICTGETPAAIKLKVTKLSGKSCTSIKRDDLFPIFVRCRVAGVITARFKKYFS